MPAPAKRSWNETVPSDSELHLAKRRAVLRLAAQSFNRQGYRATTLDALARQLGVTKAALYYYFPNKDALLKACFDEVMDAAFANLAQAKANGRDGREKLRMVFAGYLGHLVDELNVAVVVLEGGALTAKDRKDAYAKRDRFERALRALVEEGMRDGSIVPCDPKLVILTLLGAVNWVPRWFRHDGEWSSAQLAEAMSQVLDRAISTRPPSSLVADVSEVSVPAAQAMRVAPRGTRPRGAVQ